MKIAVLGTRGFPNVQGGIESHCENLYTHLAKKGCEVIVFARKPYVNLNCETYKGVKFVHLPCLRNKFLETFLHTFIGVFAAKKVSLDVLHIHGIGPSLIMPIARILGLKVVMTNHGPDYERKKWKSFAKVVLVLGEFLGTRFANAIICISRSYSKKIKEKYHRDVVTIPNGVVLPQIAQSNGMLKKHGLTKGKYVLSVGRLVPEKGFHDLIKAFRYDGWKLVIVGDADHPDRYSLNLKEKAFKNNNIVFTGFLTGVALRQLYSYAGLFVLPSYYEGLPIVLLEAMSYGLPCIASDILPNRSVGLDRNSFFKAGDVNALSVKIKEFINKPLSSREKKRQSNIIAKRYDWKNIATKTLNLYRQVLKEEKLI